MAASRQAATQSCLFLGNDSTKSCAEKPHDEGLCVCLNLADVLEGSAADRLSLEKAPWLVMTANADFNFQLK